MAQKDVLTDANKKLQAELTECQRSLEVLRSELDLCTAILNTVTDLLVVFDRDGYIVRCNRTWEQTTGYLFDEVRNQPFWELFLTQGEKEQVLAAFERIQVEKLAIAHENDWITKDGSRRSIAWSNTPFLDSSGSVKYVIGTGIDITAANIDITPLKQTEAALQHRIERDQAERLARGQTEALVRVSFIGDSIDTSGGAGAAVCGAARAQPDRARNS